MCPRSAPAATAPPAPGARGCSLIPPRVPINAQNEAHLVNTVITSIAIVFVITFIYQMCCRGDHNHLNIPIKTIQAALSRGEHSLQPWITRPEPGIHHTTSCQGFLQEKLLLEVFRDLIFTKYHLSMLIKKQSQAKPLKLPHLCYQWVNEKKVNGRKKKRKERFKPLNFAFVKDRFYS